MISDSANPSRSLKSHAVVTAWEIMHALIIHSQVSSVPTLIFLDQPCFTIVKVLSRPATDGYHFSVGTFTYPPTQLADLQTGKWNG